VILSSSVVDGGFALVTLLMKEGPESIVERNEFGQPRCAADQTADLGDTRRLQRWHSRLRPQATEGNEDRVGASKRLSVPEQRSRLDREWRTSLCANHVHGRVASALAFGALRTEILDGIETISSDVDRDGKSSIAKSPPDSWRYAVTRSKLSAYDFGHQ